MKLIARKETLISQANELTAGKVPSGVRPFKVGVDVAELDMKITSDISGLNLTFDEHLSFREAKEKLYMAYTALNKVLDARVMEHQIANLRKELTADHFVTTCNEFSRGRTSDASDLMNRLGIGGLTTQQVPQFPRQKLLALYSSVMDKVAQNKKTEQAKQEKAEITVAKKIEKLKGTAPHDLLEATIRRSVAAAIGKKIIDDTSIDYGAAYSMIQANREDLLENTIKPPPGLEQQGFGKGRKKVKEKGKKGKDQEKKEKDQPKDKGRGKGKEPKDKGKGKGKGKSKGKEQPKGKGKNKGKGKTGDNSAWQNGRPGVGQKNKGRGKQWRWW